MKTLQLLPLLLVAVLIGACDTGADPAASEQFGDAPAISDTMFAAIDSTTLRRHIEILSSDEFEGRGAGTRGEEMTVEYIREQMQEIGLEGGMPDGSFFQNVPLLGSTPVNPGALTLT